VLSKIPRVALKQLQSAPKDSCRSLKALPKIPRVAPKNSQRICRDSQSSFSIAIIDSNITLII
jgi:hypothetical protein